MQKSKISPVLRPTVVLALLCSMAAGVLQADVDIDPYSEYRDEVDRGEFSYDDSLDIPWIESETEVLAIPKDDDLQLVETRVLPAGLELLVDTSRITVDPKDGIVRLWLMVRSKHGAVNGTFEGFRCETREYKVYAYANPARKPVVSKARAPRWASPKPSPTGNYRMELMDDYFCRLHRKPNARDIREALNGEFKRGGFFVN